MAPSHLAVTWKTTAQAGSPSPKSLPTTDPAALAKGAQQGRELGDARGEKPGICVRACQRRWAHSYWFRIAFVPPPCISRSPKSGLGHVRARRQRSQPAAPVEIPAERVLAVHAFPVVPLPEGVPPARPAAGGSKVVLLNRPPGTSASCRPAVGAPGSREASVVPGRFADSRTRAFSSRQRPLK